MAAFTDDLLLEILSRVPAMSLCRFKCVSTHWLGLIDHPDQRKKLPQPMAGFFYTSTIENQLVIRFFDLWERRQGRPLISPSFAFLPAHQRVDLLDGCNGLLLLYCWYRISSHDRSRYIVCNPTTEQWVELPDRNQPGKVGTVSLCFDAAVSWHFHVFIVLLDDLRSVTGVDLYPSQTRRWVHKDRGCNPMFLSFLKSASVFHNGYLHFCTISPELPRFVAAVHTIGETWTNFDCPGDQRNGFIQLSQGRLHYALFVKDMDEGDADIRLEVHVMEDYESKEWAMKHSINVSDILKGIDVGSIRYPHIGLIALHPDFNFLFFTVGPHRSLVCYNIDLQLAKLITHLV